MLFRRHDGCFEGALFTNRAREATEYKCPWERFDVRLAYLLAVIFLDSRNSFFELWVDWLIGGYCVARKAQPSIQEIQPRRCDLDCPFSFGGQFRVRGGAVSRWHRVGIVSFDKDSAVHRSAFPAAFAGVLLILCGERFDELRRIA
jgi:hypothetical protein